MARLDILDIYDSNIFCLIQQKMKPYFNTTKSGMLPLDTSDISDHFEFATPERPFSFKVPDTHEDDNLHTEIDTDRASLTLASPMVTVTRTDLRLSQSRNNTNQVRKVRWWDDGKTFWVKSHFPRPFDISYQIDVYARFREDANKLLHWFMYGPNPVHAFKVDFGYPWGKQRMDLILESIIDTSVIEAGENERWIRHTIPVTLQAFMFEAFETKADIPNQAEDPNAFTRRVRAIKTFNIEIVNWQGDVVYETYEVNAQYPPDAPTA
jgi:hypothetical protein